MIDQTNMNQVGKDESKPSTLQTNFKQTGRCNIFESSATMYHPLENLFESTMIREGREVTAVTSGQTFTAFMRREDDGNSKEDRIKIFYPIDAPINQGMIIAYGTKKYILINRETEENECYYKSYAVACNAVISLNDGTIVGVPSYTADMERALEYQGSVFSIIQGNMEFICENNATTRNFKVNDVFSCFGRVFKITNTYYKDGMVHLIAEVTLANANKPENVKIELSGYDANYGYALGDMLTIIPTLYENDKVTDGTVRYESSDLSIATVDSTGTYSFIGSGAVTISVYWVEMNIYETIDINVKDTPSVSPYSVNITCSGTSPVIKIGGSYKKFTGHIFENGVELAPEEGIWTIDCPTVSGLADVVTIQGADYYGQPNVIGYKIPSVKPDYHWEYHLQTAIITWTCRGITASIECEMQML